MRHTSFSFFIKKNNKLYFLPCLKIDWLLSIYQILKLGLVNINNNNNNNNIRWFLTLEIDFYFSYSTNQIF
jgi:hypothetical protein